jgi:hypothetical protein
MLNGTVKPAAVAERTPAFVDDSQLAYTTLVNRGRDTKLTFCDGSTLVLKGVTRIEAVFPLGGAVRSH